MSIAEESRFNLYRRLSETLGEDEAATLMDYLPPTGWADVATKRDLDQLRELTSRDLMIATEQLKAGYEAMGAEIRSEMQSMGAEIRSEMQSMGAELRVEMHGLRSELHAQQRNLMVSMMAMNGTIAALCVAAVKIL